MNATELFTALCARGFSLRAEAGRVSVAPSAGLSDADREAIRACKPGLLRLLGEADDGPSAADLEVADAVLSAPPEAPCFFLVRRPDGTLAPWTGDLAPMWGG
jgi:hypothetical protein